MAEENVVIGGEEEEIAEANGFKIQFDLNAKDASGQPADQDVSGLVVEPTAPTRLGYVFDGWYNGTTKWDFTQAATGAMTLTAKWTAKKVVVKLNKWNATTGNYDAAGTVDAYYDGLIAKPAEPTWDNYLLDGWYTTDVGADRSAATRWYFANDTYPSGKTADDYKITKAKLPGLKNGVNENELEVSLYAAANSLYKVTFKDADGKTIKEDNTVVAGQKMAVTAPAVAGKTFSGWTASGTAKKADNTKEYFTLNTDKTEVTFDNLLALNTEATPTLVLTAAYSNTEYTVTYYLVGINSFTSTGVVSEVGGNKVEKVKYNEKAVKPTVTTSVAGTMVEGWYEDNQTNDPTKKFDFDAVVTGNHKLYPKIVRFWTVTFKDVVDPSASSLTYNTYGTPAQVEDNTAAKEPAAPSHPNSEFLGWYTENSAKNGPSDTKYDFSKAVTADTTLYAKYNTTNVTTYRVIAQFMANDTDTGFTGTNTQYVVAGKTAVLPQAVTDAKLTKHTIDYWYNVENSNERFVFGTTPVNAPITVKAAYKGVTHTVKFVTNGGGTIADQQIAHGELLSGGVLATATRGDNYQAAEWYKDAAFTPAQKFNVATDTITEDITLYAKWIGAEKTITLDVPATAKDQATFNTKKLKVRYDTTIADAFADTTLAQPEGITLAKLNSLEGTTGNAFDAWYKGTNVWSLSSDKVTEDFTLTAKFIGKSYTVKFETDGGTAVTSQAVNAGDTVNLAKIVEAGFPAGDKVAPAKTGYRLEGWYMDEAKSVPAVWTNIQKDTTYYAKWEIAKYTVTFDTNDLLSDTGYTAQPGIKHGEKATKVPDPQFKEEATDKHFKFLGWTTTKGGTTWFSFDDPIVENLTLYPHFDAAWKVTFYQGDGATEYADQVQYVLADGKSKATEPKGTELNTSAGLFVSWLDKVQTAADAKAFDFSQVITKDTNVYAKTSTASMVTVTFNGGTGTKLQSGKASLNIKQNTKLAESDVPVFVNEGKTFDGWVAQGQTTKFNFNEDIPENVTLNAQWKAAEYKVVFNVDGSAWRTITVNDGEYLKEHWYAAPAKAGYTFDAWYTDSGLTEEAVYSTYQFKKDVTLYAKYTAQKFDVTFWRSATEQYAKTNFETDDSIVFESDNKTLKADYGKAIAKLPTLTETAGTKSFAGWYTDAALTKAFDAKSVVTGDLKLFAKFMNKVTVEVVMDGWTYDGTAHQPKVTVKPYVSTDTVPAYTLSYKKKEEGGDNFTATAPTAAGTYVVKASVPAGTTTSPASAEYTYVIDKATASLTWPTSNKLTYNGTEQAPVPTITGGVNGETVPVVITGKGTMPGSYKATATLPEDGNYRFASGTVTTFDYTIEASTTEPIVTAEINPDGTVTVTVTAADGSKISENKIEIGKDGATNDFTVTTKDNGDGTVTVTLTAKEGAGFKLSAPIVVIGKVALPTATKITALKPGKKKMTVSWDVVTDADGYEIQYGLKKGAAGKMTPKQFTGAITAKATIKKLKKGKRYYFRIRTYKTVNGTTVYSDWSAWKRASKKQKIK